MHKIDLKINRAFCILPFVHLHVNEKNDIKLCCIADNRGVKKYTKEFDFANDPDMQEIRMNTNATNLNKEYRQLLSQFKNLNIVVSLDGYDQINQYIRWPADWDTIVENVRGISQITPNLAFNVSVWNISNLSKLINFLDQKFPNNAVLLNKVMYPPHQEFTAFPNRELALADLDLLTMSNRYETDLSFKGKVDYYISEMQSTPIDLMALREFFKYNDTLDDSRNIKLIDYIPELEQCRDYINDDA
jgi:hypothetical protein